MDEESEAVAFVNLYNLENEPEPELNENPNPVEIPFEDVVSDIFYIKHFFFSLSEDLLLNQ